MLLLYIAQRTYTYVRRAATLLNMNFAVSIFVLFASRLRERCGIAWPGVAWRLHDFQETII